MSEGEREKRKKKNDRRGRGLSRAQYVDADCTQDRWEARRKVYHCGRAVLKSDLRWPERYARAYTYTELEKKSQLGKQQVCGSHNRSYISCTHTHTLTHTSFLHFCLKFYSWSSQYIPGPSSDGNKRRANEKEVSLKATSIFPCPTSEAQQSRKMEVSSNCY